MKNSPAPYLLALVFFVILFVVAVAIHSNNEAKRLEQLRIDTNLALREYCTTRKLIDTDCRVWVDAQINSLSQKGVEWASGCIKGDPPEHQLLFCLNYAKDLK